MKELDIRKMLNALQHQVSRHASAPRKIDVDVILLDNWTNEARCFLQMEPEADRYVYVDGRIEAVSGRNRQYDELFAVCFALYAQLEELKAAEKRAERLFERVYGRAGVGPELDMALACLKSSDDAQRAVRTMYSNHLSILPQMVQRAMEEYADHPAHAQTIAGDESDVLCFIRTEACIDESLKDFAWAWETMAGLQGKNKADQDTWESLRAAMGIFEKRGRDMQQLAKVQARLQERLQKRTARIARGRALHEWLCAQFTPQWFAAFSPENVAQTEAETFAACCRERLERTIESMPGA